MKSTEVIVAGAGIIGLSAALELARNGFRVRVLEKGNAMREASWAAAGMLSGQDPEHPPELAGLAQLSIRLYPEYLRTVEDLSGRRVRLRTRASLIVGQNHGCSSPLSPEEAQRRVPGLATKGRSFCWMDETSLDPRDLCLALPLAATAAGVDLKEQTEVLSVRSLAHSVEVTTAQGTISAEAFVDCCGAWSGQLEYLDARHQPTSGVGPWKGQIFKVLLDPPIELPYVLRAPEVYLVPRGKGEIVIGATVEQAGFDRRVDPAVVNSLLARAAELWPPIAGARIEETWAGLRPGTPDGLPIIGDAGQPRCWVATGHFRNGILLAPGTGLIVRQLLQGESPAIALDAFAAGRLTASASGRCTSGVSDKIPNAAL
ncbi:MAG TPA: FAD-dependent oxidoreductase [Acidobacteriaceae bacterium]|nr:FAD-dependent oxidoreductase [Acidobacteriaceae bacterium]